MGGENGSIKRKAWAQKIHSVAKSYRYRAFSLGWYEGPRTMNVGYNNESWQISDRASGSLRVSKEI